MQCRRRRGKLACGHGRTPAREPISIRSDQHQSTIQKRRRTRFWLSPASTVCPTRELPWQMLAASTFKAFPRCEARIAARQAAPYAAGCRTCSGVRLRGVTRLTSWPCATGCGCGRSCRQCAQCVPVVVVVDHGCALRRHWPFRNHRPRINGPARLLPVGPVLKAQLKLRTSS